MARRAGEELERRIVRWLDGELSAAEREQLTRELLRDPEARRRMEEYAAADERAAEALRAAFTHTGPAGLRNWESPGRNARGTGRRWAVRAAAAVLVAAAGGYLAYLLAPGGEDGPKPGPPGVAQQDRPALDPPPAVEQLIWQVWHPPSGDSLGGAHPARLTSPAAGDVSVPLPAIQGPRRTRRAVDRHLFGVYDDSDNTVYLLGVDRVRKTVHAVGKDL